MVLLLSVSVVILALLLWGAYTLLRWLSWRVTVWVVMLVAGVSAVLSPEWPVTPATQLLVQVWSWSLIVLPLWWAGRGLWRRRRARLCAKSATW